MATRADFYIGRGKNALWLASIAFDGYPEGIQPNSKDFEYGLHLFDSTTEGEFTIRLEQYLAERSDVTRPSDGWPWPWKTSSTTDFAYALDGGKVYASCFGGAWFDPRKEQPEEEEGLKSAVFPDMSLIKNVARGHKSGLIVLTSKPQL